MSKPRMIQGQFGSVSYNSGLLPPGLTSPAATATVAFNEVQSGYQGVPRHNDVFYQPVLGQDLSASGIHFATYEYVDLRDLLEEKACMDDVTINVQRMYEVPYPNLTFNMPPGNIEETFLIVLGNLNLEEIGGFAVTSAPRAGFAPLKGSGESSQGGLPFEILYREVRQYVQDPSQNFVSDDQIGSQAGNQPGADPTKAPTRFVGNFRMTSRTIGGYPDILVGPGLTVIRAWSIYPADRGVQAIAGLNPADTPAEEFLHLSAQVQCQIPALQYNIVGTQRKLTATETATYYSNILMKQ